MIERLIFTALRQGIRRTCADSSFLARHLKRSYGPLGVTDKEIARLVLAFTAKFADHPRPVIHQYARSASKFPLWSIVLGDEHETKTPLGRVAGDIDEVVQAGAGAPPRDPDAGAVVMGAFEGHVFHVFSYSLNPDFTLLMDYSAKAFLRRAFPMFQAAGLFDVNFSGGDVSPGEDFPPELFVRRRTISLGSQEEVVGDLNDEERRAYSIDGVELSVLDADGEGGWVILPDD